MANLPSLRVFLTADTKKYETGLKKAQAVTRAFASGIKGIAAVGATIGASLGGAVAVVDRFASVGDAIGKGAARLGVTTDAYQKLSFAAERSGASASSVEGGFRRMTSVVLDAENGLMEAKRSLETLGLSFKDLKGQDTETQFKMIAEQIANVSDHSKKAALAQDVFGRSGMMLLPMIDNYKNLSKEAEQFGLITENNIKAAEKFKDEMTNLKQQLMSGAVNSGVVKQAAEAVAEVNALAQGYGAFNQYIGGTRPSEGDVGSPISQTQRDEIRMRNANKNIARMRAQQFRRGGFSAKANLQAGQRKLEADRLMREFGISPGRAAMIADMDKMNKEAAIINLKLAKLEEDRKKEQADFWKRRNAELDLEEGIQKEFSKAIKTFMQSGGNFFDIAKNAGEEDEFADAFKSDTPEQKAQTEQRLASVMEAGSSAALKVAEGSGANLVKKNSLANQQTAKDVRKIRTEGFKVKGLLVVNNI